MNRIRCTPVQCRPLLCHPMLYPIRSVSADLIYNPVHSTALSSPLRIPCTPVLSIAIPYPLLSGSSAVLCFPLPYPIQSVSLALLCPPMHYPIQSVSPALHSYAIRCRPLSLYATFSNPFSSMDTSSNLPNFGRQSESPTNIADMERMLRKISTESRASNT